MGKAALSWARAAPKVQPLATFPPSLLDPAGWSVPETQIPPRWAYL